MRTSRISQLAAAISLLLLGCQDSITFPEIIIGSERIAGQVIGGSGPAAGVRLRVELAAPSSGYDVRIYARADDDGRFDIAVPPGSFFLSLDEAGTIWYSAHGLSTRRQDADTLRLGEGQRTVTADFVLGGVEVDVALPAPLEERYLFCVLRAGETSLSMGGLAESGRVSFAGDFLPPGTYTASIEGRLYGVNERFTVWLPATLDSSQAERISILPRWIASWEGSLPEPGHLQGIIRGWEELTEYGPSIEAYGPDSVLVATQRADEDGAFAIPIYAAGRVRIRTEVDGIRRWLGGQDYAEATEFPIGPGATVTVDTIRASGIVGHLIGDPAWQPYQFHVLARDPHGERVNTGYPSDRTTFTLPNLRPGAYFVAIASEDGVWRPQWYDRRRMSDEATPIALTREGEIVHVDVVLEEGGTISGRITRRNGTPASHELLRVIAIETEWSWDFRWRTETDGSFLIDGLPDDDIMFGIRDEVSMLWYPGTSYPDSAVAIPIRDAGHVTGIDFRLPR